MAENPKQSVGFVLHDVARLMRRNFDRRAQSMGLTRAQWFVLAHLRIHDGARQTDLADMLEVQPITLARMVDRLEADGWVERRNDPEDRRAKRVFLTPKVAPIMEKMKDFGQQVREQAFAGVAKHKQELLMEVLIHMRENLAKSAEE